MGRSIAGRFGCCQECRLPLNSESSVSGRWMTANSMAMPSSKWRTTWPRMVPSVTWMPSAGLTSISTAAPESDRSMMRHWILAAVDELQHAHRIARRDAFVAAVFRQVEFVLVGEPGELRGELVLLAVGRDDGHREAVLRACG